MGSASGGELQSRYTWDLSASSGAGTALDFQGFGLETTFYFQLTAAANASSGVTLKIESARLAAGPWATIASTQTTSSGALLVMQVVTGPLLWVRPNVGAAGVTVEGIAFG